MTLMESAKPLPQLVQQLEPLFSAPWYTQLGKAKGTVMTVTITTHQCMKRIMVGDTMTVSEIAIAADKII